MNKQCQCGFLEEIHGFDSPYEFERFCIYIKNQLEAKSLVSVKCDPKYEKGLIFGGEWYRCVECNEIWRLVPPDFPFTGLWEKVK